MSKRREYHVDLRAKKAATFFVACDANSDTRVRVKIPDAMRAKGYSDSEAADRSLQQQVRREADKIKGEAIPVPPAPAAAAASALMALSATTNVGRPALRTITPVPAAVSVLPAAGVAALPSPPRKTRKTSHQEQIARQNERKHRVPGRREKRRTRSRRCGRMSGSAGPSRDRDRHMRAKSRYAAQIGPANPVKKSTIPQSTVGYLFGRRIRRGTERQLCLWRRKIEEKIDALGVGKAWPIGERASHFNGSVRSYTSNTPQSTSAWLDGGGIGQGMEKWLRFVVCIFLEFWPAGFFNGIIRQQQRQRQ
jgi:hypothetical protein